MSSFTNTSDLDNLLLQSLMDRLQIRPPSTNHRNNNNNNNPLLSQSLEDLLFDAFTNHLDEDDDDDENDGLPSGEISDTRSRLAKEESKLEKHIIRTILSGKTDSLKPNSGQAVSIEDHHICVGFHEDEESDYRVWEWHGHIMLFDEENGYSPEYIYGNYFERLVGEKTGPGGVARKVEEEEEEEEEEEKVSNSGLRGLIDGGVGEGSGARILHRNINAGSSRV